MADLEGIAKAALVIVPSLIGSAGVLGRKRRMRARIRDNLALIEAIYENPAAVNLRSPAAWLQGATAVEIARLAGHQLGKAKKPIPWSSFAMAIVLAAAFAAWAYVLNRDGFSYWSLFPGITAGLFAISVLGMITGREIPPEESNLPEGAMPIRSDTAAEQVATAVASAASGEIDDRWDPGMPIDVVLKFLAAAKEGNAREVRSLSDDNLNRCRDLAWRHSVDAAFQDVGIDMEQDIRLDDMPDDIAQMVLSSEADALRAAFGSFDLGSLGAASRRRVLGPKHELVIITPTPSTGGYWVNTATALPDAIPFVVSSADGDWKVASVGSYAAPLPTWPPTWWNPVIPDDELPDGSGPDG